MDKPSERKQQLERALNVPGRDGYMRSEIRNVADKNGVDAISLKDARPRHQDASMNAPSFFTRSIRALFIGARIGLRLFGRVIQLLANSAQTSPDDDLYNLRTAGVLNYRTRKLDDGTDPFGWYQGD